MLDDKKVAFITCANSDWWYSECRLYLEHLNIPEGMKAEIIDVRDAASMTSGYNHAMKSSDAKYKIYLHQDTFVVNKNLIADLLKIFHWCCRNDWLSKFAGDGRLVGRNADLRESASRLRAGKRR